MRGSKVVSNAGMYWAMGQQKEHVTTIDKVARFLIIVTTRSCMEYQLDLERDDYNILLVTNSISV